MNKLILCTTGTSIAKGCPSLRDAQGHRTRWDDPLEIFEAEIEAKLKRPDYDVNDSGVRRHLSAELNTLDRLKMKPGDKVVLLSTDSAPGRICSEKLFQVITEFYGIEVEIERIEGLQIYDPHLLRETGLKNLVKVLLDKYLDNDNIRYNYEIIINPTGGYKAIVPFLTVLGMIYGKSAIYLFEHAEELIHLPPLPLTFDIALYERVKRALQFIEDESAVTEQAYLSHIDHFDPAERDLFLSFTEPFDEGLITLSPLAYVLLKIEERAQPCLISDKVNATFEKLKGEKRTIMQRLLANASNPLWRQQKAHRWRNSNILILKQGRTAERLAGFSKGARFHVALAYTNHDEYEKDLARYTLTDLEAMHYTEWKPSDFDTILQEPFDDEKQRFLDQITELSNEVEHLKISIKGSEVDAKLVMEKEEIEEELELARMENEELVGRKAHLEKMMADQKKALLEKERILQEQLKQKENELQSYYAQRKEIEKLKREYKAVSHAEKERNVFEKKEKTLVRALEEKNAQIEQSEQEHEALLNKLKDQAKRMKQTKLRAKENKKRFEQKSKRLKNDIQKQERDRQKRLDEITKEFQKTRGYIEQKKKESRKLKLQGKKLLRVKRKIEKKSDKQIETLAKELAKMIRKNKKLKKRIKDFKSELKSKHKKGKRKK